MADTRSITAIFAIDAELRAPFADDRRESRRVDAALDSPTAFEPHRQVAHVDQRTVHGEGDRTGEAGVEAVEDHFAAHPLPARHGVTWPSVTCVTPLRGV